MSAMRPPLVEKLAPLLDEHLGFGTAAEPLAIQQLVAQLAVETFNEAVLPRAAGRDEGRTDRRITQPAHHLGHRKFRPVVGPNDRWLAVQPHQPRPHKNHVLRTKAGADLDGQAFPCVPSPSSPPYSLNAPTASASCAR